MLEFAYTGEVNVAQDLLPSLLETAKAYRIKGLDKVESPVEPMAPSALQKSHHLRDGSYDYRQHQMTVSTQRASSPLPGLCTSRLCFSVQETHVRNETVNGHPQEQQRLSSHGHDLSPPPSCPGSQPPTRESSPCPGKSQSEAPSRTPPPKRWKRSFDMSEPAKMEAFVNHKKHVERFPMVSNKYTTDCRSHKAKGSWARIGIK